MKKSLKLMLNILIVLALIVGCFLPFHFSKKTKLTTNNFEVYSNAYISLMQKYATPTNQIESITFEKASLKKYNDDYLISLDNFPSKPSLNIAAMTSYTSCYSIFNLAKEHNYEIIETEKQIILSKKFASKRLILKSNITVDKLDAIAVASGYKGWQILQFDTEQSTEIAYNYYKSLPYVEFVVVDDVIKSSDMGIIDTSNNISAQYLEGSNSYQSWGASFIGADAYNRYLSTISNTNKRTCYVAVLDTGIDTDHAAFGLDDTDVSNDRVDFTHARRYYYSNSSNQQIDGKANVEDVVVAGKNSGHGTHVSGTIVDLTPSNVKIIPIKILDNDGTGYLSSAYLAVSYIATLNSPSYNICAINLSIGGECNKTSDTYKAFEAAIAEAHEKDISVVVAAGNGKKTSSSYTTQDCSNICPANINSAITVASIDNTYTKSDFSNYGSTSTNFSEARLEFEGIDICAPGRLIKSAVPNGAYSSMSGTSMATPHVTACIALLNVYNPTGDYTLTNIENYLLNNAIDQGSTNWDGHGLVYLSVPTDTHIITLINSTPNLGTVTTSHAGTTQTANDMGITINVIAGEDFTYTATANENTFLYKINGIDVSADYPNISNDITIHSVNADLTINLEFRESFTTNIKCSIVGNGKITDASGIVFENTLILHNKTSQELKFVPDENYKIANVEINGVDMGAIEHYELTNSLEEYEIDVTFEPIDYAPTTAQEQSNDDNINLPLVLSILGAGCVCLIVLGFAITKRRKDYY